MHNYPYKFWRFDINNFYGRMDVDFDEGTDLEIRSFEKEALYVKAQKQLKFDPFKDKAWNLRMQYCEMQVDKLVVLRTWNWDHTKQEFVEEVKESPALCEGLDNAQENA